MSRLIFGLKVFALVVLLALAGLGIYSLSSAAPEAQNSTSEADGQVWTCSMHPQVRKNKPGNCPICGMPLILASAAANGGQANTAMLQLSEHALAMASVETAPVEKRELAKEIRAVGKIQYNETALATVVSRTEGYIERLFVDYTGVTVNKGDHLVEIYSPDLVVGLRELLIFRTYTDQRGNSSLATSRTKLKQWGVTDEQIERVLKTGNVEERVTLYSPITGTVTEKMIVEGSYVNKGEVLYKVANLESVWVHLDIYEYELAWVQYGQQVEFAAEAYPGQTFKGIVTFVSPVLNDQTRTVKVRVNLSNADRRLKPGMYVTAAIRVPILAGGKPGPTGLEGKFICPMHPEVIEDNPGKCRICGMNLEQLPGSPQTIAAEQRRVLAVRASAVLDSGRKKLVYVEKSRGQFAAVEVTLGPRAGEYYPVLNGLNSGDRVAVRGNFLLDSQFQIEGKPSLFATGGPLPAHQHGDGPAPTSDPAKADHSKRPPPAEHKH